MTETQAVVGRIQLRRMAGGTATRQANVVHLAVASQPFAGYRGVIWLLRLARVGSENAQPKFYYHVRPEYLAPG